MVRTLPHFREDPACAGFPHRACACPHMYARGFTCAASLGRWPPWPNGLALVFSWAFNGRTSLRFSLDSWVGPFNWILDRPLGVKTSISWILSFPSSKWIPWDNRKLGRFENSFPFGLGFAESFVNTINPAGKILLQRAFLGRSAACVIPAFCKTLSSGLI